jgi:hypothetical protein
MPAVPFTQLPDDARLWIFGADRPLDSAEAQVLLEIVDSFVAGWAAHGAPVVGARDWRYDRFLLVAADERATGVSGCSTDTLFHALGAAEARLGVSLRDGSRVFWRDAEGTVRSASRPEFRALAAEGQVDGGTTVFDNTVPTVGDLRGGRWETAMADAWHARAFPVGAR